MSAHSTAYRRFLGRVRLARSDAGLSQVQVGLRSTLGSRTRARRVRRESCPTAHEPGKQVNALGRRCELRRSSDLTLDEFVLLVTLPVRVDRPPRLPCAQNVRTEEVTPPLA